MNARELALAALVRAEESQGRAHEELQRLLGHHDVAAADRALAMEITQGAVRHRRTLDLLLAKVLDRRLGRVAPAARLILECAAYQIVYLDRVPDYATVNESVELARSQCGGRWPGLVNAVLRKVSGLIDRDARPGETTDLRRLVPSPRGGEIVLRKPLLPREPQRRLADAYSFPDFLVHRWFARRGESRTAEVLAALNRPPHVYARVNTLRGSAEEVLGRLPEGLRQAVRAVGPRALDVTGLPHELLMDLLGQGLVTVEDPTAMLTVEALGVQPGERVLDLCAAPGGKTSYIVELMEGRGTVWALDRTEERLGLLRETLGRLGLAGVHVGRNEPAPAEMPAEFDRVLVDVPCSNTGVLNRRADARWRLSASYVRSFGEVQLRLLGQGAAATRVGGVCVYSTCSLEPEENGGLVRRFLSERPWMALQVERETVPSAEGDGGYFARLTRIGAA